MVEQLRIFSETDGGGKIEIDYTVRVTSDEDNSNLTPREQGEIKGRLEIGDRAIVAEEGEDIIGILWLSACEPINNESSGLRSGCATSNILEPITALGLTQIRSGYVEKDRRGSGVFKRMVNEAQNVARGGILYANSMEGSQTWRYYKTTGKFTVIGVSKEGDIHLEYPPMHEDKEGQFTNEAIQLAVMCLVAIPLVGQRNINEVLEFMNFEFLAEKFGYTLEQEQQSDNYLSFSDVDSLTEVFQRAQNLIDTEGYDIACQLIIAEIKQMYGVSGQES